jgi:hypothetical protein
LSFLCSQLSCLGKHLSLRLLATVDAETNKPFCSCSSFMDWEQDEGPLRHCVLASFLFSGASFLGWVGRTQSYSPHPQLNTLCGGLEILNDFERGAHNLVLHYVTQVIQQGERNKGSKKQWTYDYSLKERSL